MKTKQTDRQKYFNGKLFKHPVAMGDILAPSFSPSSNLTSW